MKKSIKFSELDETKLNQTESEQIEFEAIDTTSPYSFLNPMGLLQCLLGAAINDLKYLNLAIHLHKQIMYMYDQVVKDIKSESVSKTGMLEIDKVCSHCGKVATPENFLEILDSLIDESFILAVKEVCLQVNYGKTATPENFVKILDFLIDNKLELPLSVFINDIKSDKEQYIKICYKKYDQKYIKLTRGEAKQHDKRIEAHKPKLIPAKHSHQMADMVYKIFTNQPLIPADFGILKDERVYLEIEKISIELIALCFTSKVIDKKIIDRNNIRNNIITGDNLIKFIQARHLDIPEITTAIYRRALEYKANALGICLNQNKLDESTALLTKEINETVKHLTRCESHSPELFYGSLVRCSIYYDRVNELKEYLETIVKAVKIYPSDPEGLVHKSLRTINASLGQDPSLNRDLVINFLQSICEDEDLSQDVYNLLQTNLSISQTNTEVSLAFYDDVQITISKIADSPLKNALSSFFVINKLTFYAGSNYVDKFIETLSDLDKDLYVKDEIKQDLKIAWLYMMSSNLDLVPLVEDIHIDKEDLTNNLMMSGIYFHLSRASLDQEFKVEYLKKALEYLSVSNNFVMCNTKPSCLEESTYIYQYAIIAAFEKDLAYKPYLLGLKKLDYNAYKRITRLIKNVKEYPLVTSKRINLLVQHADFIESKKSLTDQDLDSIQSLQIQLDKVLHKAQICYGIDKMDLENNKLKEGIKDFQARLDTFLSTRGIAPIQDHDHIEAEESIDNIFVCFKNITKIIFLAQSKTEQLSSKHAEPIQTTQLDFKPSQKIDEPEAENIDMVHDEKLKPDSDDSDIDELGHDTKDWNKIIKEWHECYQGLKKQKIIVSNSLGIKMAAWESNGNIYYENAANVWQTSQGLYVAFDTTLFDSLDHLTQKKCLNALQNSLHTSSKNGVKLDGKFYKFKIDADIRFIATPCIDTKTGKTLLLFKQETDHQAIKKGKFKEPKQIDSNVVDDVRKMLANELEDEMQSTDQLISDQDFLSSLGDTFEETNKDSAT